MKAVSKEVKVAACQGTHPLRELERRTESQGLSLEKHPETKRREQQPVQTGELR